MKPKRIIRMVAVGCIFALAVSGIANTERARATDIIIKTPEPSKAPAPTTAPTKAPVQTQAPVETQMPSNVHQIIYNTNGGILESGALTSYKTNTTHVGEYPLPIAQKDGYLFLGWYKENGKLLKVLKSSETRDFILKAKWVKPKIKISNAIVPIRNTIVATVTGTEKIKGCKYNWTYDSKTKVTKTNKKSFTSKSPHTIQCGCTVSRTIYGRELKVATESKNIIFYKNEVTGSLDEWLSTASIFGTEQSINNWFIQNINDTPTYDYDDYIKINSTKIGLRKYFERATLVGNTNNKRIKVNIKCKIPIKKPTLDIIRYGNNIPSYYKDKKGKTWCRITFSINRTAGYNEGYIEYKYKKHGPIKGSWDITKNLSSSFTPGYDYYFRLKLGYGNRNQRIVTSKWIKATITETQNL